MPLEKAPVGSPGFSRNVETEVKAGKPVPQAVAIAYRMSGERSDAGKDSDYYYEMARKAALSAGYALNAGDKNGHDRLKKQSEDFLSKANSMRNDALDFKEKAGVVSDAERDLMGESTGDDEAILGRKDATPTIRQENGQWVITIDEGTNTSIFRLDVREYPTKAEALEYALSNPQYTNRKDSLLPLDRALAAADSLYAKALKTAHKADAAIVGAKADASVSRSEFEAKAKSLMEQATKALRSGNDAEYDRLMTEGEKFASRAGRASDFKHPTKADANERPVAHIRHKGVRIDTWFKKGSKEIDYYAVEGSWGRFHTFSAAKEAAERIAERKARKDAERDLPGSSTTEGNYGIDAE